jgi:hypothetical protein
MTHAEFDRLIERASDPTLVPGIYNYCDRRCGRCAFSGRCLQYREEVERRQRIEPSPDAPLKAVSDSCRRAMEMIQIVAQRQGIDLADLTADDDSALFEEVSQRSESDPLVVLARRYSMTAAPIARVLERIVAAREDLLAIDAVDTIGWFSFTISAKVFRAVSGANEPDFDPGDQQSDPNGSAKIARLFIDESRRAWRVLMQVGRAAADGVPAHLVAQLDQLDAGLAARFPRAMHFIRPGFDEETTAGIVLHES